MTISLILGWNVIYSCVHFVTVKVSCHILFVAFFWGSKLMSLFIQVYASLNVFFFSFLPSFKYNHRSICFIKCVTLQLFMVWIHCLIMFFKSFFQFYFFSLSSYIQQFFLCRKKINYKFVICFLFISD